MRRLPELARAPEDAPDRAAKVREFCKTLATRAFRRPLTPELERFFVDRPLSSSSDLDAAVKRVVLLVLKSPRFLFREIGGQELDNYDVASRLSFGLWDSLPDPALLEAAAAGQLSTREQVAQRAERMLTNPRTRFKVRDFLLQWLHVDQHPELAKDASLYPGFDAAVATDLRTSLELFLDEVICSERSDFRELLLANRVPVNGRLAKQYGLEMSADAPFQPVEMDLGERAGVVTHPYLLASFAYLQHSSPIHRGVMIARGLLGRTLRPPPVAVAPVASTLHPNLTTRQRVELQTKPAACSGCHGLINPLGYTLEKFDAIGRLRTRDNNQPVDTRGGYQPLTGKPVQLAGARDLARYLADSPEVHAAFTERLFQHLVKQPVRAYGPSTGEELRRAFTANQYHIRRQIVETLAASAGCNRKL